MFHKKSKPNWVLNWIKQILGLNSSKKIELSETKQSFDSNNSISYIHISTDWNADPNVPRVRLEISKNELELYFDLNYFVYDEFDEGSKAKLIFKDCSKYSLNRCNDEGYYYGQYRIGPNELQWGDFYEIRSGIDTNFPEPVVQVQTSRADDRHFIFFFKDETFECLASNYILSFYDKETNEYIERSITPNYRVFLDQIEIGTTQFEFGDAPMGVAFGELKFHSRGFGYNQIKNFWFKNNIDLASDDQIAKSVSTMSTEKLVVLNQEGVQIKGVGNQITGSDQFGFEISVFGIPYPFYENEFPKLVNQYKELMDSKNRNGT